MSGWARRALIGGLAAALTFTVLWWGAAGLGWLRQGLPVERVLASRPDVLSYHTAWSGDTLEVEVLPAPGVDLPEMYTSLHRQLQAVLGNRPCILRLEDRRDAVLQEAIRIMRLYLEEALVNGRFSWADRMVREIAAGQGLDWARMSVDSDYVYVELRHGQAYLYEVVPRSRPD